MFARPEDVGSASAHHDGQEDAGADPSWDGLPSEVLVLIMHHIPQLQRHKCSLVNTAWRAAAVAATTSIPVSDSKFSKSQPRFTGSRCQRCIAWINAHAAPSLTSLSLRYSTFPVQLLPLLAPSAPLADLRALALDGFVLSSHTQWLWAMSLTRVALKNCRLPGVSLLDLLADLGALPNLVELSYRAMEPEAWALGTYSTNHGPALGPTPPAGPAGLPGSSAWGQLTQLTLLELANCPPCVYDFLSSAPPTVRLLSQVAGLSQLKALLVGSYDATSSKHYILAPLQHMQGLTRLQLPLLGGSSANDTLGVVLPKLTSLQHLEARQQCWGTQVEPSWASTLSSLSRLRELRLEVGRLTEANLAALSHLACCGLSALTLEVQESGDTPSQAASAGRAPLASFAALTAGSTLQLLHLRCRWGSFAFMPAGVWEHLFPNHRVMPFLQSLTLSQERYRPVNAPTLQRLVNCCPGLTALTLEHALQPGTLSPLVSLTGLKLLQLAGKDISQPEVCAQLTGLQRLDFDAETCHVSTDALMSLTALKGLKRLRVVCTLFRESLCGRTYRQAKFQLSQQTPERFLSDVPSQLRQVVLDERRALEADEAALPAEWLSLFD